MSDKLLDKSNLDQEVDLLLRDLDYLITCNSRDEIIPNGAVAIKDGLVVAVGESKALADQCRALREMSLPNYILMPGLVNCHVHVPMSIFRGLADDLPLQKWLYEVIFPAESKWINPATVYTGSLLSLWEMIRGGVTCFCDGYFFEEEVARAAIDLNVRVIAGQGVLDYPTPDNPDPAKVFERVERFLSHVAAFDADFVKPSIFCHSPYTCSEKTLKKAKDLCRTNDMLFQIHLAETKWEQEEFATRYGKSSTGFLEDLHILDERTIAVHGVWIDKEDIVVLKDSNGGVVHCIESNLKLGSGVADVPLWIGEGVKVGIGTDGPASNNDLDMFAEMSTVAKIHKGTTKDPTCLSALDVLKMATIGGAKVLGLEREIGSIEVGKKADLVALSVKKPHLVPLYEPVSHIVYAVKSSDVDFVWIGGKMVLKEGRLSSVEESGIIKEIKFLQKKVSLRG